MAYRRGTRIWPEPLIYDCVSGHIDAHIYGTNCTVAKYIEMVEEKGYWCSFCLGTFLGMAVVSTGLSLYMVYGLRC